MININDKFPSLIKYMGSKTEIINFIEHGINMIHKNGQTICDLFAGSATLSAALRGQCDIVTNDIQQYSEILAKAYLFEYCWNDYPSIDDLCSQAEKRVNRFHSRFPQFYNKFNYDKEFTLEQFNSQEKKQQKLIEVDEFEEFDNYYLFTKYYSGTYWSYEQCVWIDSVKYVADKYKDVEPLYVAIMASLMFAMAYNSQSTGHYAQYRDAKSNSSMEDILIYRRKDIKGFFARKLFELKDTLSNVNDKKFKTTTLDYKECLKQLEEGTLVYADPPYCFVHYSRFYHAIETLVRYDYPQVSYKGRYREDRHQSPFCIKKQVNKAFEIMFNIIKEKKLDLVLSYSNSETNTINLIELVSSACCILNNVSNEAKKMQVKGYIKGLVSDLVQEGNLDNSEQQYDEIALTNIGIDVQNHVEIENLNSDEQQYGEIIITNTEVLNLIDNFQYDIQLSLVKHNHSTMGRREDRVKEVKEILLIAQKESTA